MKFYQSKLTRDEVNALVRVHAATLANSGFNADVSERLKYFSRKLIEEDKPEIEMEQTSENRPETKPQPLDWK